MTNASTTNLSVTGSAYLSGLTNTFLAVNGLGQIIATTTPTNYWSDNGTTLSPVSSPRDLSISGNISATKIVNYNSNNYNSFFQTGYSYHDDLLNSGEDVVASVYGSSSSNGFGVVGRGLVGVLGESRIDSGYGGAFVSSGNNSFGVAISNIGSGGTGLQVYSSNGQYGLNVNNASTTGYSIYSSGGLNKFEGNTTLTSASTTNFAITGIKSRVLATDQNGNVIATTTGGTGTVTSVDMSVPIGLSVSGNPVTTSGTLALTLTAGYNIPTTASTTIWDGVYDYLVANAPNWNNAYNWGNWASNFGTTAGTIAQGNDSRINNGQTAFGWGNHASAGYLTNSLFDTRLAATTSLSNLGTLAGLFSIGSSTGQTTILGKTVMTNASTTNLTVATAAYLTGLGSSFLSVNAQGQIIATTTPLLAETLYVNASSTILRFGTSTNALTEGSNNLFWTNVRFDTRLAATTSLPSLATLAGLTTIGSSTGSTSILGKATLTNATTTSLAITGLTSKILATDQFGNIVATTTGGTGTVTSVDMSVPTGLSISGNPITTSGTLALTLTSGYNIPLTASTTNWNTAFGWGNHASAGYLTNSLFDTRLAATTSLSNLGTLAGLFSIGSSTGQTTILGKTVMTNASTTNTTVGTSLYLTGLGSSLLSVDTTGKVIASSTPTLTGLNVSGLTASQIVATDASKNLVSLAVATYPSLSELSYVKGVTSNIQTQLGGLTGKANTTLNNLGSTAINAGLISGTDGGYTLGSPTYFWGNTYTNSVVATEITAKADGTSALHINKADGATVVLSVDTTNSRVSIGTTSAPAYKFVVQDDWNGIAASIVNNYNTGNSAMAWIAAANGTTSQDTIRLAAYGSGMTTSGAAKQDGGELRVGPNLSGGLSLTAVGASADMRFYTGGSADANQWMTLKSTGRLGIGTTTPAATLDTTGGVNFEGVAGCTSGIKSAATTGALSCISSDRNLKNTIEDMPNVLDKVLQLKPVTYYWNSPSDGTGLNYGLIAQDVEKFFPDSVFTFSSEEGHDLKGINWQGLDAIMLKALQEQQAQIKLLQGSMPVAGPNSLNEVVLNNIKAIQSASGNWSISEDGTLVAKTIKAEDAIIENGVTVRDRTTGNYSCIFVDGGVLKTSPGQCESVTSSTTTPAVGGGQVAGTSTEALPGDTPSDNGTTTPSIVSEEPILGPVIPPESATEPAP